MTSKAEEIPAEALASEHIARLRSYMPRLFWFRDYHAVSDGHLHVEGYLTVADPIDLDQVVFELDGREIEVQPSANPRLGTIFWFVPPDSRLAFKVWEDVRGSGDPPRLTVRLRDLPTERHDEATLWHYGDLSNLEPTPPTERIERVSGPGASAYNYFNNGLSDFRRFCAVAKRHGLDAESADVRLLDWGSGCARLTRHFLELPGGPERVTGVDIDADNIQWSRDNLGSTQFEPVDLMPPTRFESDSFDLIIANSVLSHLTREAAEAWLDEIHRLLKPGGLALLSYHGEFSAAGCASRTPAFVDRIVDHGFDASLRADALDGVIESSTYYRQTFMTDAGARALFEAKFQVVEQVVGVVSRYQNLGVLRPK